MEIKNIQSNDLLAISEVFMGVFNAPPWNESWSLENSLKKVNEIFDSENFLGFVAIEKDKIIAFLLGNYETYNKEISFFLREIAVLPSHQNEGIGTKLLKKLEIRLSALGVNSVFLITDKDSIAEKFYLNFDYSISQRAIIMKKNLTINSS